MPPTVTLLPQVILKFGDFVDLPYIDDVGPDIESKGFGPWSQIEAQFPGVRIRRLYRRVPAARLKELVDRAVTRDPAYKRRNFLTYFVVEVASPGEADHLASVLSRGRRSRQRTSIPCRSPVQRSI